jgi:hypothetical protein
MSTDLPKQRDRMAALAAAQTEMSAIVSENRITAALAHNVRSSVDRTYEVGEEVLVFREKVKNQTGPMVVVLVEDKINRQRFWNQSEFYASARNRSNHFFEITFYRRR